MMQDSHRGMEAPVNIFAGCMEVSALKTAESIWAGYGYDAYTIVSSESRYAETIHLNFLSFIRFRG